MAKGTVPDSSDTGRERDAYQADAEFERLVCNVGDAVAHRNIRQTRASIIGIIPDRRPVLPGFSITDATTAWATV